MNVKSMLIPPKGAEKLASRLDPPEYGTVSYYAGLYYQLIHTYSWGSCICGILLQAATPLLWI